MTVLSVEDTSENNNNISAAQQWRHTEEIAGKSDKNAQGKVLYSLTSFMTRLDRSHL